MTRRANLAPAQGAGSARKRSGRAAEILAAARRVFSEKGYAGASMADIAARVGIVEGAIYKHYAGKRDLLVEVMESFYSPMIEDLHNQVAGIAGTRNKLRFVIWRQLRAFADEPGLCRVVIGEIRPHDDYYRSEVADLNRRLTSIARSIVDEGVAAGELREGISPVMVRDVIYGGIEHIAWRAAGGRSGLDVDREADDLTDLIMNGVGPVETGTRSEMDRLSDQVDRLERMLDAAQQRGTP